MAAADYDRIIERLLLPFAKMTLSAGSGDREYQDFKFGCKI